MRFGSVCSGIEAASVAWHPLGWRAAWLAEIEPFPCAVLAHHYPDVPNLGDMTTIVPRIRAREVEAPDVFTGGTPCQAFSFAGKRESLADARGNLSLTFVEIADAVDDVRTADGRDACVVVWENVPGVLSTPDNAFGCFLGALAGAGGELFPPGDGRWADAGVVLGPRRTVAWRVLDAQFFGLAQRRRRVFVVASARDGFDPGAVLLEFDGVRRDSPPRREAREDIAGTLAGGARRRGGYSADDVPCWWDGGQVSQTLDAVLAKGQTMPEKNRFPAVLVPEVCPTLRAGGNETGGHRPPGMDADTCASLIPVTATTIRAREGSRGVDSDCTDTLLPVAFDTTQITSATNRSNPQPGDPCHPLAAAAHPPAIAAAMRVRRLTPVECERLQGFPDNHTRIPWRGRPAEACPDGPRYKALGNSWAVPCARWIGARIHTALTGEPA